jgi:hypothetical protein
MIPILNPGQYPAILSIALLLTIMMGIPTAFISLVTFFLLERVPSRWGRLILPAAGAVLMLSVSLWYFSGIPQSPEEYQKMWVPMMLASFILNTMVILAPFPFLRRYIPYSPYRVIPSTLAVTFFLLVAFGFMGGDAQLPPGTEYEMVIRKVQFVLAEFVTATFVYGCIALLGTIVPGIPGRQE